MRGAACCETFSTESAQSKYCAMGGGAPFTSGDQVVGGIGVSGGSVEQDVAILEAGLRDA